MEDRKPTGFTLVELMIVVVILGVLAAIAVPVFLAPYHYSKTAEVQALLRDIAAKEEAYKSEFGQYLNVSGAMDFSARRPATAPRNDFGYVAWNPGSDAIDLAWKQLGFAPQGAVRFGYVVIAGLPGVAASGAEWPAGLANTNDHWWAAVAYGNVKTGTVTGAASCGQYYLSSSQNVIGVANEGQ